MQKYNSFINLFLIMQLNITHKLNYFFPLSKFHCFNFGSFFIFLKKIKIIFFPIIYYNNITIGVMKLFRV